MNLKITLPDPKYCNGCPCYNHSYGHGDSYSKCEFLGTFLEEKLEGRDIVIERPQICIKTNGE